jgi:hypothetical protein
MQSLESVSDRIQAPGEALLDRIIVDSIRTIDLLVDGTQHILIPDLLNGCGAHDAGQVAQMCLSPTSLAGVMQAETQQERLQSTLRSFEIAQRCFARA